MITRQTFKLNSLSLLLGASVATLVLAGCASSVKLDEGKVPVEDRTASSGSSAAGQSGVSTVNLNSRDTVAGSDRIVYFDFDSYVVRDDARGVIDLHAKRLTGNGNLKITVEGHTDDRGGREYNLALGQKRAEAVVKSLTLLGAKPTQLEAVSFGMERPAATGNDESAWAKNRRAELKDR